MSTITIDVNDDAIAEKLKKFHSDLVESIVQDHFRNYGVQQVMREEIKKRIRTHTDKVIFDALEKIDITSKVEESIDAIIAKRAETLFKARMKAAE